MHRRPKCLKCGRRNQSLRWGRCCHCLRLRKLAPGAKAAVLAVAGRMVPA